MGLGRRGRTALGVALGMLSIAVVRDAEALRWDVPGCEPPFVFYSSQHQTGTPPCCATVEGLCPGGGSCPPEGRCANEDVACVPASATPRPNVILMIADDLGSCHYGHAGECRSVQSG